MVGVLLKLHEIWEGEMTQEYVKSTDCSCREPEFASQYRVEQLAAALTPAPGSSGLQGHLHTCAHSQSEISEYTYLS